MKFAFVLAFLVPQLVASTQPDTIGSPLTLSGYLETYYIYDFGRPINHLRPDFITSYRRANEVNINLALLKMAYREEKVRGNVALAAGTYADANLVSPLGLLNNLFEANIGVKLSNRKNLWLDAGVFPSHLNFESPIGADSWTMTRSMAADNAPYYLAGAKLTYTTNDERLLLSALVFNGWERILSWNQMIGVGHQVIWRPSDRVSLHGGSFIGSETPREERLMRYFHHFHLRTSLSDQWGLIIGFDIGAQEDEFGGDHEVWYTPVIITRFALTEKWALAGRLEYYSDPHGVIVRTGTPRGFQTLGYSLNLDYQITDNVLFRVEGGWLNTADKLFFYRGNVFDKHGFVGASLSLRMNHTRSDKFF